MQSVFDTPDLTNILCEQLHEVCCVPVYPFGTTAYVAVQYHTTNYNPREDQTFKAEFTLNEYCFHVFTKLKPQKHNHPMLGDTGTLFIALCFLNSFFLTFFRFIYFY